MLLEAAFVTLLHITGSLLAMCIGGGAGAFRWLSGVFWGMLIWVVWGLALLSIGLPFTAASMIGGILLFAIFFLVISIARGAWSVRDAAPAIISTLLVFGGSIVCLRFNCAVLSYDSFLQVHLGQALAYTGRFHPEVHPAMASWGAFVLVLQAAAVFLDIDFLFALWPVMGLMFLVCFLWLGREMLRALGDGTRASSVWALAGAAFISSAYFLIFQCFYIHNNLPSAIYQLLAVACLWLGMQNPGAGWLGFSTMAFGAFILLRTEAPLFAAVFLAPILWNDGIARRTRLACTVPLAIGTVAWYARLIAIIGPGTDILQPKKAFVLMGLMAALAIAAAIPDRSRLRHFLSSLPWLMLLGSAGLILAAMYWKPALMRDCFIAMMDNLFMHGRWGITWAVLLVACAVAIPLPRFARQDCWTIGPAVFLMLLWVLGAFRDKPYRVGWGDSANRIATHVVPLLGMYLVLRFGSAYVQAKQAAPRAALRPRLIAGLVILVIAVLALVARMPVDISAHAIVLETPAMHLGHEFKVALHPEGTDRYAAANASQPATVVIDLGRLIRADRLEMTEYAVTEAWTDYAWQVSADREHWTNAFDTRTNSPRSRRIIDECTSRFSLSRLGPFRYLRLDFRAALGQNRLLLRGLRIYSLPIYDLLRALGWRP